MTRFSIRGLLTAVAFVAVACAALKYAGPVWWTILSAAALLLLMGSTIVVVAGKGEQRIRAAGCTVCLAIYGVLLFALSPSELIASRGQLPTTKVMQPVAEFLSKPPTAPNYFPSRTNTRILEAHKELLRTAHLLWALLFGFLGSWFAGFVYRKNQPRPQE